MGVVMLIAAFLIARNRASGIILYAVAFIASLCNDYTDSDDNSRFCDRHDFPRLE
jgi:general stress protein CsbA